MFLYLELPFVKTLTMKGLTNSGLFLNHLAIFLALFVVVLFLISKHIGAYGSNLKIIFGSLILLGLFLTLFYHLIPIAPVYKLPTVLDPFFASTIAFEAWLVIPIAFLFF